MSITHTDKNMFHDRNKKWSILLTDYAWASVETERQLLSEIGAELTVAKTGDETELLEHAPTIDGLLTCWKPVQSNVISSAKKCQIIARCGIGLDNIDVETATQHGIVVTNVPAYCVDEVSDHALALLLASARKIPRFNTAVKNGTWEQNIGPHIYRLRGKTVGIVGFGKIAKAFLPKARSLGLKVIVYSPRTSQQHIENHSALKVNFHQLLNDADFITIHAPLTSETEGMFATVEFQAMKPTAVLINTARGGIVNTEALTTALVNRDIAGAALDVLQIEPPQPNHKLLKCDNVILTPHAAFISEEALLELQVTAASCVTQLLTGQLPESVVNPEVLERPNLRAKFN